MSSINFQEVAARQTTPRLKSYLQAAGGDVEAAIHLYDWNTSAASALHGDLGRLEVIFRNAVDDALLRYGSAREWPDVWYRRMQLFPGRHARRAREDIADARQRATRGGRRAEVHDQVIAGLNFGFWRYLCEPPYLTSLRVPAVASAFPLHPAAHNPGRVRADVADKFQQVLVVSGQVASMDRLVMRAWANGERT
ncbi:hypothetical protein [Candidatus Poriferisodalis sp.]|uniref:hypothetical protein n=1 Tax=Candidatus Poriferisodalis sp. TaxID=3101277 RepID=UPI003C6F8883